MGGKYISNTSHLKVNIFSKGKLQKQPDFMLNNDRLEVVDDFDYCGV